MRTRPAAFVALALFALVVAGCSTDPMPEPSGTMSPGAGGAEPIPLSAIEDLDVVIDIETMACNALREDCEKPKFVHTEVPYELKGDPVTVPFRDGTLTVEYVRFVTDDNEKPVDVELKLTIIANDTQDFYGSYGADGGSYYDLSEEPYSFYYDSDWEVFWPFIPETDEELASIEVEQWGGNGRHSIIYIDLYDTTTGR
jgi:hypothetical protein